MQYGMKKGDLPVHQEGGRDGPVIAALLSHGARTSLDDTSTWACPLGRVFGRATQ